MNYKKIYIPDDAVSVSLGANEVANAFVNECEKRNQDIEIIRNGSRGLFWLEPLIEFEGEDGRIGFKQVKESSVSSLLDSNTNHSSCVGLVEEIPFLKNQKRLTFEKSGKIDSLSFASYKQNGGLTALRKSLSMSPNEIIDQIRDSGLRGRGGAGFPAGIKWNTVAKQDSDLKYVVCNADEGDSGTFADRLLMEGDPFLLVEGMAIAGIAVGAEKGFIYIRSEYPDAYKKIKKAIEISNSCNLLGRNILNSSKSFDIEVRLGAGAYICGEETSLLESLEGRRGQVRSKPPLPAIKGLFGFPTLLHNVLTLAAVPTIIAKGANHYNSFGFGQSRGTMPIQLGGNIKFGGLIELEFGKDLSEIIFGFGGGTFSGRPIGAIQAGGPLGAYWPESFFSTPYDYESYEKKGGMIGHGGVVVFDDTIDLIKQARFALEFCAIESCGKCTPCRIGSIRGVETMDKIILKENIADNLSLIRDLCEVMKDGSLCALGGLTPMPVLSTIENFPEVFMNIKK